MCLLLFAYRVHPDFPLVVAANRDEFHRRPAAPADWWPEGDILAGRDLQAGGTWFGVSRQGRFASVTNYREPSASQPGARSRGELVVEALRTEQGGHVWLQALAARGEQYNGFNLLFGSTDGIFSYSNRSRQPEELAPGVYGLSNHLLETPWPKVLRGKALLQRCLEAEAPPTPEALLTLLGDRTPAPDRDLPATGVDRHWERLLSPMFIVSPDYGTRASTALLIDAAGEVTFMERSFDADGAVTTERRFQFRTR